MDNSQNTNLQQPTTDSAMTGNPQQIPEAALQPQNDTALQPGSPQSVNSINQLDQGAAAIPISAIPNTATATVQQTTKPAPLNTKTMIVYGGTAIIVGAIMSVMVYRILRQQ